MLFFIKELPMKKFFIVPGLFMVLAGTFAVSIPAAASVPTLSSKTDRGADTFTLAALISRAPRSYLTTSS